MVTFSSVAQSISLTWICVMARFEAETFSHMCLNFRGTKCDSFFRNLANPEYPFAMSLLMVKNPNFNTISSLKF